MEAARQMTGGKAPEEMGDGVGEALERRGIRLADEEEGRTYEDSDAWRDVVKLSPADR